MISTIRTTPLHHAAIFLITGLLFLVAPSCSLLKKGNPEKQPEKTVALDTALKDLSENKRIEYQYKFIEATRLRLMGSPSDALEYFYQCSQIQPHAPAPYYQMSLIANQIDEPQEAVKYAKKAVLYGPDNKWYRINLANLYLKKNATDSALTQYDYLVNDIGVKDLDLLFRAAQLYQKNERYQEALKLYNRIEERTGFSEQIAILKKMLYTRLGQQEKAVSEVKQLIRKNPDNTRYYGMLAELYATFKEYDKAKEMYDKLFQLDSTNNLGQLSMVKYYNQQEKYGKSIRLLKDQVIPNPSVDFRDKMLFLMAFLSDNRKLSRYQDQVGAALDSMAKYHPEKSHVHAMFADYYLRQNKYRKAIEHLKILVEGQDTKYIYWDQLLSVYSLTSQFDHMYQYGVWSLEDYPRKPRLYLLTSIGALQTNRADTAALLLEKGKQYIRNNRQLKVQFLTQLGEAHYQKENFQQAWQYFEQVLRLDPGNTLVLNNYSYYLSQQGIKLDKALQYSGKVLEQEPDNPIYLDTYAWILFKQEKYGEALEYIEKAIDKGGDDDADIVEHYGDILFKTGDTDKAVRQWEKARNLGNDSEQIEYKINHRQLPPDTDED